MSFLDTIRRRHARLQRKGLAAAYPELAQRQHLYSSATRTSTDLHILDDYVGHAQIYRSYTWVKKAIGIIVQNIAPLPVRVVDAKGEALPAHPLSLLFTKPNDVQPVSQLWEEILIHLLIGGEWFLEIVDDTIGRPAELWARRPDHVQIVPDAARLNYPKALGYVFTGADEEPIDIPATGMIRDRFANPLSAWRGIAPTTALRQGIIIDILAQSWTRKFLDKGARPDYAVVAKNGMTDPERKRLEEQLLEKFGGVQGSHLPIILDDEMDIKTFSFAPRDLAWLEERRYSRDEVGAIFGVPDEIMGYGKDTYENFEASLRVLWTLTLLPLVQRRDVVLTHFFSLVRPMLRPGERIATDLSSVGVLQEDDTPRIAKAKDLWGMGVPFNTLDERLRLGIGPIPGGEVGYLPANLLPADEAVAPVTPSKDGKGLSSWLRSFTLQSKAARATRRATAAARKLQRLRRQVVKEMTPEVDEYFADLAEAVIERATKAWPRVHVVKHDTSDGHEELECEICTWGSVNRSGFHVEVKDLPSIDTLFELEDREDLRLIVQRFYAQIIEASWDTWNGELGTEVAFDLEDPIVVDVLRTAGQRIRKIEQTTKASVQQLLVYGAEQGWSIQQLIKGDDEHPGLRALVQETYKNRARAIARTELGEAQQRAATLRYEDAGVEKVLVLDDGSANSDQDCKDLNGTVQTLEWAKANLLGHPNCVRAFAPYFED